MSVVDDGELFGPGAVEFESPELQKLFAEVREFEAVINEVGISEEEVSELLGEFDARWPYMNKTLSLSGSVIVAVGEQDDDEAMHLEPEYFEDAKVQSLGFNMIRMMAEDNGTTKWVLGHAVVFGMEVVSDHPMRQNFEQKRGFAPLDNVIIDYPFESQTTYFDRLHYRFPDIAGDIDEALFNTTNESEAVKALAGLEVVVSPHDTPESFEILADYVNSVISFDHKVPYEMQFGGKCYVVDADGPDTLQVAEATPGFTLAYPLKVQLYFEEGEQPETSKRQFIARLGLRIVLINEDKDDDTERQYLIPITENFDMHDVRSLVYIALNSRGSNS